MKPIHWDEGYHFDDPNLRWGDPAYTLEPGDPGYVPPAPPVISPKPKIKRMRRNAYYPIRIGDQIIWLANFANKLPAHAATFSLAAGTVTDAQADARWPAYLMQLWLPGVRTWALGCTDVVTEAQTGAGTGAMTLPTFTAPALPSGVVPVAPGALDRLFALVQTLKDSGKMTEAIATDLGIIGSEATAPDLNTVQPNFKARVTAEGVFLDWGWGGNRAWLDMIEFEVDRGSGFGFLAQDTTPGYTDTTAKPANPTKWIYRAIFRVGDQRVGQWSNPVSVMVG